MARKIFSVTAILLLALFTVGQVHGASMIFDDEELLAEMEAALAEESEEPPSEQTAEGPGEPADADTPDMGEGVLFGGDFDSIIKDAVAVMYELGPGTPEDRIGEMLGEPVGTDAFGGGRYEFLGVDINMRMRDGETHKLYCLIRNISGYYDGARVAGETAAELFKDGIISRDDSTEGLTRFVVQGEFGEFVLDIDDRWERLSIGAYRR